jgi:hypothetical protein
VSLLAVAATAASAATAQQTSERQLPRYAGPLPVTAGTMLRVALFNFGDEAPSVRVLFIHGITGEVITELSVPSMQPRTGYSGEVLVSEAITVVVVLRWGGSDHYTIGNLAGPKAVVGRVVQSRNGVIDAFHEF